jgi:hypothetical protein
MKIIASELKELFLLYANSDEFPETLFEWHEYDGQTKQVFIWVEGKWNSEVRTKLQNYLRKYNKKLLVSRMIRTREEKKKNYEKPI